jgi:hypothetical protein
MALIKAPGSSRRLSPAAAGLSAEGSFIAVSKIGRFNASGGSSFHSTGVTGYAARHVELAWIATPQWF